MQDIHSSLALIASGQTSRSELMANSVEIAGSTACRHAFLSTRFDAATAETTRSFHHSQPLGGLAISVKDLFDVKGEITGAGSRILAETEAAKDDCLAVKRLKRAGGVILGRTNMSEFAYSGVGTNPHFHTPANACSKLEQRIPGGSSSGAAVSVATGAVFVGLGSDTGGSIRIPAALNGIVGFKCTARLVPTQGAIPLSSTLDTICAMTHSVRDAMLVHEVLSERPVWRSTAPLRAYRLGIPTTLMLEDLDPTVARVWDRVLSQLSSAGADIKTIEIPELRELGNLQASGGFSAAESYAWHYHYLQHRAGDYDPRVMTRILRGASMSAREYLQLQTARTQWIHAMDKTVNRFDALISPTVPMVAPLISLVAPGEERDAAFFSVNTQLLRNPSVVNMYDGCAISIPAHQQDELPVGLMIWGASMHDDMVLNIARQIESVIQNP